MRDTLDSLQLRLNVCLSRDRRRLRQRLAGLRLRLARGKPIDRGLEKLSAELATSETCFMERRARLPTPSFPEDLPINRSREEIAAAIRDNQVVVICGETGSGKTTQIPKICLSLRLGAGGMIGHTQPRRIAARSVATRLAEELGTQLGSAVGYKVRFGDRVGQDSIIKLMTDGILLAETQGDRYLEKYEVIIIDEAHERSLNIDFLLGYLLRLLPKRPDLKLIITSATIDPESFSRHFNCAPIIDVSGRTYPVEIRYRPLLGENEDDRDRDLQQAILDAVDEVSRLDQGDILVFMSGEREIRETAENLRKHHLPHTEILPLYARQSAAEQGRVFKRHSKRRIICATNVAETSLTVPGIRFVIDPGMARISRYSHRSKVQRLPIERISQAAAKQRAGRCGRLSAGLCMRLYSEEDLQARPPYTEPEILRTNLAAVILRMCTLELGEVENFPFIDPPETRRITDGFKLLYELGAVDERRQVTVLGRQLAQLPIDPRLGRMLVAARQEGCLREVLIIASALAIQDPRERPLEHQQAADERHRRFRDERSDFEALLKLWNIYHEQARHLSQNKLRGFCQENFLSFVRMREWHDLHQELHALVTEMGMRTNQELAAYESLHRALLTGLLGHVGMRQEDHSWLGARGRRFYIYPGSGLFKRGPKWLMAAELVETTRLYARTVAKIDRGWIEALAGHLVKRSYSEPHWDIPAAQVTAFERVTLYGLPIVVGRRVNYGPIDPGKAREIFIRDALVKQALHCKAPFFKRNREVLATVAELEVRWRRRDLGVDEEFIFRFFDQRVPEGIYSGPQFESWRKRAERTDPRILFLEPEMFIDPQIPAVSQKQFPDHLAVDGMRLPLSYRFEPGAGDDGVTLSVPLVVLNQVNVKRLEWLVPGLLAQRMAALLKSLPKNLRKHFVPVPDYVKVLLEVLRLGDESLTEAMAAELLRITGVRVPSEAWNPQALPEHLKMRLQLVDASGTVLAQGRDLAAIQERLREQARESFAALPTPGFERDDLRDWDFGDLPEWVEFTRDGLRLKGYPALVVEPSGKLALRLLDSPQRAENALRTGLRRLIALRLRGEVRYMQRHLPGFQQMCLHYLRLGSQDDLRQDLLAAIIDRAFLDGQPLPRSRSAFEACLQRGRSQMMGVAEQLCILAGQVLAAGHEVRKLLSGTIPLAWQEAVADIQEQVDRLLYRGFISRTPYQWLQHLPRYLKAIQLRVQKLARAPDTDRQRRGAMAWLWEECKQRLNGEGQWDTPDPELQRLRWMLEELRVSLFAQELKTAFPVSVKRVEAQLQKVRQHR